MNVYKHIMTGLTEALEYAGGDRAKAREAAVEIPEISEQERTLISAQDVAKWLIAYNNSREDTELLSDLKLQKLLYYAQGTAIKYTGKPMFSEDIVAWKLGPVVPEVYNKYKSYGRKPIDEAIEKPEFDNDTEVILMDVCEEYGQFAASKLVDMTHGETPWKETPQNSVITIKKMEDFFAR